MASDRDFWTQRRAPLRWLVVWLFYASMRALAALPLRWQLAITKSGGRLAYTLVRRRRRIVETNLALCFPELAPEQRRDLALRHFEALGASIAEMAMGWYGRLDRIRRLVEIEGAEHLERAIAAGRGVILYCGHFTSFEIFFPLLAPLCPRLSGMYKVQANPLMNRIMTAGRRRNIDYLFDKDNVRDMIRELKRNAVVWYASDQNYAWKGSALIPFFGEPAMTNTALSRIARISGAVVLPYLPRRLPDDSGYRLTFGAPFEGFPSDDEIADTRRLVAWLEESIRQCPEQYWWVHQRFKSRPAPYPDVYASANEPV